MGSTSRRIPLARISSTGRPNRADASGLRSAERAEAKSAEALVALGLVHEPSPAERLLRRGLKDVELATRGFARLNDPRGLNAWCACDVR